MAEVEIEEAQREINGAGGGVNDTPRFSISILS
jgi:hypothetical protein